MRRIASRIVSPAIGVIAMGAVFAEVPQPVAAPFAPVHVVTYLEVAPASRARVAALLRRYRDATRAEPGNLRAIALRRIERHHHFALLETWADMVAADAHNNRAHTISLREALQVHRLTPPDERVLKDTATIPLPEASAPKNAVYVITHADALPPASRGTDLLLPLAESSRRETGNLRFEVLQQPNRLNHCTLVEIWRTQRDADAHALTAHSKSFREKFQGVTGALYDERLYTTLD